MLRNQINHHRVPPREKIPRDACVVPLLVENVVRDCSEADMNFRTQLCDSTWPVSLHTATTSYEFCALKVHRIMDTMPVHLVGKRIREAK